jgi:hypothetical protein
VCDWPQSAATPRFVLQSCRAYNVLSVRLHEVRWYQQQYAWEGGQLFCDLIRLVCHLQVLKDPDNKRKVLERTPMRRIGETHEVSGAPGCHRGQLTVTHILLRTWQSQGMDTSRL